MQNGQKNRENEKPQRKISEPRFGGTKNYELLADLQCYEHYG